MSLIRAAAALMFGSTATRAFADKTPADPGAAQFTRGEAAGGERAGFYLRGPGECFGGGGVYHIDMPSLTRIRHKIVDAPAQWAKVRASGVAIEGDALSRAPAGFDPAHKYIEDLRRKDMYTMTAFTEKHACAPDFLDRYTDACERAAPLMEFLTKALGLRW